MINNRKLIRQYAAAVAELAYEQGVLDQVEHDLTWISELVDSSPELQQLIQGEGFTKELQASSIRAIFSDKVHEITLHFLLLLVQKHRIHHLSEIIAEVHHHADKLRGVLTVSVATAYPLEPELSQALQSKLSRVTGYPVRLTEKVEPALIGGIRIQIGDKVSDGSVTGRLRRLKSALTTVRTDRNSSQNGSIVEV